MVDDPGWLAEVENVFVVGGCCVFGKSSAIGLGVRHPLSRAGHGERQFSESSFRRLASRVSVEHLGHSSLQACRGAEARAELSFPARDHGCAASRSTHVSSAE